MDVERPLLPKLSYLIQKYANEEEVDAMAQGAKSVSNLGHQSEMAVSAAASVQEQVLNDQTKIGEHTWEGLKEFAM